MIRKKFIYVFLNNKIISCDSILPLMLEVKSKNKDINIIFWSFDFVTYEFIKKNDLLYRVIEEIGCLVCLGRKKNSKFFDNRGVSKFSYRRLNLITHFFAKFYHLISLIKNIIINKVIFIHFRALNLWPLKMVYYLNKKNTILSHSDSSGWSSIAYRADQYVHKQRRDSHDFSGTVPVGSKVLSFSVNWPHLKHPSLVNAKKYIMESPHKRKVWLDYLKIKAKSMIEQSIGPNHTENFCVLILGHIGVEASGAMFLRNKDSWTTVIEDILDIIHDECPGMLILIKPHIITDMKCLENIIAKRKHIKIKITNLHPAVLAVFSKFAIASYYSTAFESINCLGGLTIEYTDQKIDYLKKLDFKSKRPEFTSYFFNNDEKGFRNFLSKLKSGSIKMKLFDGSIEDRSGIIDYLTAVKTSKKGQVASINISDKIKEIFKIPDINIFLNNKLISLDTILPIIFILKGLEKSINITVYVFNKKTYQLINKNILLKEAINDIGNIYYFNTSSSNKIIRNLQKASSVIMISRIIFQSLLNKNTYIHFKALNTWPFKILYIFNPRRTLYWNPSSTDRTKTIDLLDSLTYNIREKRIRGHKNIGYSATAMVSSNRNWDALNNSKDKNVYLYDDSNLNSNWIKFLFNSSKDHLNREVKKKKYNLYVIIGGGGFGGESGIIPYIEGHDGGVWNILEDIINTIDKLDDNMIYYKLHPNTNSELRSAMKDKFKKYNIVFGNLHHVYLAQYAKCFLVTHWSNALSIPHKLGVPTIEFTNYNEDALRITNYGSPVPSTVNYFIQNDKNELLNILKKIDLSHIKMKFSKDKELDQMPDIINKLINQGPF